MILISPNGVPVEIQDFQESMFKAKGFKAPKKPAKKKNEKPSKASK